MMVPVAIGEQEAPHPGDGVSDDDGRITRVVSMDLVEIGHSNG